MNPTAYGLRDIVQPSESPSGPFWSSSFPCHSFLGHFRFLSASSGKPLLQVMMISTNPNKTTDSTATKATIVATASGLWLLAMAQFNVRQISRL